MTRLEQLTTIHAKLDELYIGYLLAQNTKDKRRREKAIREVKNDIADYSLYIPYDIKKIFDIQVGANSLNFQHADDISQCLDILKKLIKDEKDKAPSGTSE